MNKLELLTLVDNEILLEILEMFDDDEDLSKDDLISATDEFLYSDYETFELVYYYEAFEYLQDQNITDFEEAIKFGNCTDIVDIANYYKYENDRKMLQQIGLPKLLSYIII